MIDFASFGLATNVLLFCAAALVVWLSGSALTRLADAIAGRLGWGQATVAIFVLAAATSLPEVAISLTAALDGDAPLAVNNLLGSVALQITLLAMADFAFGDRALTSIVPDPVVMLQGAICACLLTIVAAACLAPDASVLGAGMWSWGLLLASIYGFKKITDAGGRRPWIASGPSAERRPGTRHRHTALAPLLWKIALGAASILVAGYTVSKTGRSIAQQTGLGSSFMGVAFVALATSLPEASTVFAAMRRGLYTMAISDILGTNVFNVALLFGVDVVAAGPPVLARAGRFGALSALLGAAVTGVFLIGLVERRERTLGGMGIDSIIVLLVYSAGLAGLFGLRASP